MTNPLYADDPDFYERPGEVVHLITDVNPPKITVPALPWQEQPEPPPHEARMAALVGEQRRATRPCRICGRQAASEAYVCDYCGRAQQRDQTALARAKQPTPSTPRIHVREGWEQWASEQPVSEPEGPTIGEHETRIG